MSEVKEEQGSCFRCDRRPLHGHGQALCQNAPVLPCRNKHQFCVLAQQLGDRCGQLLSLEVGRRGNKTTAGKTQNERRQATNAANYKCALTRRFSFNVQPSTTSFSEFQTSQTRFFYD
jgi:hypothetical protein